MLVALWQLIHHRHQTEQRRQRIARMRGTVKGPLKEKPLTRRQVPWWAGLFLLGLVFVAGSIFMHVDWVIPVVAFVMVVARWAIAWWQRQQRVRQLTDSVPQFLAAFAGGLRAGNSVRHTLSVAADQSPPVLREVIREALSREALGYSLDHIFRQLGRDERQPAFSWLGMALAIQRQTGGSLAQMMESLVEALNNQATVKREIRTLTAQSRASGWMLTRLVPVLFATVVRLDPQYTSVLWTTTMGWLLLAYAVLSLGVGLWVISRIIRRVSR